MVVCLTLKFVDLNYLSEIEKKQLNICKGKIAFTSLHEINKTRKRRILHVLYK